MEFNTSKLARTLAVVAVALVAISLVILYQYVGNEFGIVLSLTISALVGGYFWYPTVNTWAWKRHGENRPELFATAVKDWADAIGVESVSHVEFRMKGKTGKG